MERKQLVRLERLVRKNGNVDQPLLWGKKLLIGLDQVEEEKRRDALAVARVVAKVLRENEEVVQWAQEHAVTHANCIEACLILARIVQEDKILNTKFIHLFNVSFVLVKLF